MFRWMGRAMSALVMLVVMVGGSAGQATPEALTCPDGQRSFDHDLLVSGAVCVPVAPERVASLHIIVTDVLLQLGQTPVAASAPALQAYLRMHPDLEDEFEVLRETTVDVGLFPNVETVLASAPDLVFAPVDAFNESQLAALGEVVPVVVYRPTFGQWREVVEMVGGALNQAEPVEALLDDYDQRLEIVREALGEDAAEVEVSLVRTFPDQIGLVVSGTAGAALLESVGLARPEAQTVDAEYVADVLGGRPEILISEEQMPLAEGDVVFVFGDPSELFASPLWGTLKAVREERVHEVGYYWWGDGLRSSHAMLDDVLRHVVGVDPAEVAPNPLAVADEE
jgi:iron complex transport system substrate-binding protein